MLITAVNYLKEFQRFEPRPFVRERTRFFLKPGLSLTWARFLLVWTGFTWSRPGPVQITATRSAAFCEFIEPRHTLHLGFVDIKGKFFDKQWDQASIHAMKILRYQVSITRKNLCRQSVYECNSWNQGKIGESAIVKACLDSVVCLTADPSRLKWVCLVWPENTVCTDLLLPRLGLGQA